MGIPGDQYTQMITRLARNRRDAAKANFVEAQSGTEGDLHDQIEAECRRRMWPVIHSRMDMRTTTAKGVPDFVIFASLCRVFCIECKTKTGKLSVEQAGFKLMLNRNGHNYHVVRSFNEFLEIVKE